ncbi:MAG: hypothetical protein ABW162_14365 [Candidatus Sedimenticola sp. PURPLELP]
MDTQEKIGLIIPERSKAQKNNFLTKPEEVKSWVSNLPIANIGETSRQVFKTLVKFNRIEMPSATRIKVAEMFRQPVDYLTSNLRKYYFDASFPLAAKNRKIAVLNRELYTELAIAYKIFLETAGSDRRDQKLAVIAIHRAIRHLCQVVYQSAVIYDPYPDNTWRELHRLYALAEQSGYQDLPVKDNDEKATPSTISRLYKEILLFAISSPYRVRQREIDQIYSQLPEWSQQITLEMPEGLSSRKNLFITHLWSDEPPSHIELHDREPSQRCRQFDTSELLSRMQEIFSETPNGSNTESRSGHQISQNLARHLMLSFTEAPQREFVRTRLNFQLKVAVGINTIHSLISTIGAEEPVRPTESSPDASDWLDDQHVGNPGYKDAFYTLNEEKFTLSAEQVPLLSDTEMTTPPAIEESHHLDDMPSWASKQDDSANTFSCTTINESAGGYCISWNGNDAPHIKIGEVIGIQSASNSKLFSIGVSRWMRNTPDGGMQLGVAIMAPSCAAVFVRIKDADHSRQSGLLLPEMKASELPASLILPTLPFKEGHILWLDEGTGETEVRLTRRLETSGAFARYQYAYLDEQNRDSDNEDQSDGSDFDNIWSML